VSALPNTNGSPIYFPGSHIQGRWMGRKKLNNSHCPNCDDLSADHLACWCDSQCCDDRWEKQMNKSQPKIHNDEYVEQLIDWGFTLDFIALDAGIDVESLKMRFRRKAKREKWDGHKKSKFGISCDIADCGCC
jgi:hypothetical protein